MNARMRMLSTSAPRLLSLLRIIVGFLILCHGTQKLFGIPGAHAMHPPLASLLGVASLIETPGGVLLLVGLFTRPVAFILSGEMAVAYFTQHAPRGFWPILNGGELAVCLCFVFLYLAAAGGGPWSLDARRRSYRRT